MQVNVAEKIEEKEKQEQREIDDMRQEQMMRDAWRHEKRQPPDTYYPSDPSIGSKRT